MKKKCKWLTHKWEFTGGQGTDVYEHPRRCTRCELTDTYIDGVTVSYTHLTLPTNREV